MKVNTKQTVIATAANMPNVEIGTRGVIPVTANATTVVKDVLKTDYPIKKEIVALQGSHLF